MERYREIDELNTCEDGTVLARITESIRGDAESVVRWLSDGDSQATDSQEQEQEEGREEEQEEHGEDGEDDNVTEVQWPVTPGRWLSTWIDDQDVVHIRFPKVNFTLTPDTELYRVLWCLAYLEDESGDPISTGDLRDSEWIDKAPSGPVARLRQSGLIERYDPSRVQNAPHTVTRKGHWYIWTHGEPETHRPFPEGDVIDPFLSTPRTAEGRTFERRISVDMDP